MTNNKDGKNFEKGDNRNMKDRNDPSRDPKSPASQAGKQAPKERK